MEGKKKTLTLSLTPYCIGKEKQLFFCDYNWYFQICLLLSLIAQMAKLWGKNGCVFLGSKETFGFGLC